MNVGWFKSKRFEEVLSDIRSVKKECKKTPLKVIIEASILSDEQIADACKCVIDAGANYVKSGSGFYTEPTTMHHVEVMKKAVRDRIGLKVAGGVRDLNTLLKMYKLGAERFGIGLRTAVGIMEEAMASFNGIDLRKID